MVEKTRGGQKGPSEPELPPEIAEQGTLELKRDKFRLDSPPTEKGIKLRRWALRLLDFTESQISINELYGHQDTVSDVDGGQYLEHLENLTSNPVTGERPIFWNPGMYCHTVRRLLRASGLKESEIAKFNKRIKTAKDSFGLNEISLTGAGLATGNIGVGPAHVISSEGLQVPIPKYPVERHDLQEEVGRIFDSSVKAATHFLSFYQYFPEGGLTEFEEYGAEILKDKEGELKASYAQATSVETLREAESEDSHKLCSKPYQGIMIDIKKKMITKAVEMRDANARQLGTVPDPKADTLNKYIDLAGLALDMAVITAGISCKESINVEWALEEAVGNVTRGVGDSNVALSLKQSLISTRNKMLDSLIGDSPRQRLLSYLESLPDGVIPVGVDLADIVETTSFEESIGGAVFSHSSPQAHNLINLRKAEVPTMCQVGDKLHSIRTGETIIVVDETEKGVVILNPDPDTIDRYEKRQRDILKEQEWKGKINHLPAQAICGKRIVLQANIGSSDDLLTKVHGNVILGGEEYVFTASNVRDTVYRIDHEGGKRKPNLIYHEDIDASISQSLTGTDRQVVEWIKKIDVNNTEASRELARSLGLDIRRWTRRSGVVGYGAEGVGLYRTESIMRSFDSMPDASELEEKQYQELVEIIDTYSSEAHRNLTVFSATTPNDTEGIAHLKSNVFSKIAVRGFDVSGDKPGPAYMIGATNGYTKEVASDPYWMGGTELLLNNKETLMKPQIKAIMRAAHDAKGRGLELEYMLPNILNAEQIRGALAVIDEVAQELKKGGVQHEMINIVPLMEDSKACGVRNLQHIMSAGGKRIDRVGLGTNDMSYLAQAGTARKESELNPFIPPVPESIKNVVDVSHEHGLATSVCGEAGGRSRFTPVFLALGVDGFSMSGTSLPTIKTVVRNLDTDALAKQSDEMLDLSVSDLSALYERSKKIADMAKERP